MANGNDGPFRDEGAYLTLRGTNAPPVPLAPGPLGRRHPLAVQPHHRGRHLVPMTPRTAPSSSTVASLPEHRHRVDNKPTRKYAPPTLPAWSCSTNAPAAGLPATPDRIAPDIFHCTWASPSLGQVDGRDVWSSPPATASCTGSNHFFVAADVRRLQPTSAHEKTAFPRRLLQNQASSPRACRSSGRSISTRAPPRPTWHRYNSNRRESPSNIYGMPVLHDGRLYVAGGGDWFWGKNDAWLKCYEPRGTGDLFRPRASLVLSARAAHHGHTRRPRRARLCHRRPAGVHCVDAVTGAPVWTHELKGELWASASCRWQGVRGHAPRGFLGVRRRARETGAGHPRSGCASQRHRRRGDGVLYVATMKELFAVGPRAAVGPFPRQVGVRRQDQVSRWTSTPWPGI